MKKLLFWMAGITVILLSGWGFVGLAKIAASDRPFADQDALLQRKLSEATEVQVFYGDSNVKKKYMPGVLFTLRDKPLRQLISYMRLIQAGPDERTPCDCKGTHLFRFYKGKQLIGSFEYKDGKKLVSQQGLWQGDWPLSRLSVEYLNALFKE